MILREQTYDRPPARVPIVIISGAPLAVKATNICGLADHYAPKRSSLAGNPHFRLADFDHVNNRSKVGLSGGDFPIRQLVRHKGRETRGQLNIHRDIGRRPGHAIAVMSPLS